jgi:hypothetical protein
MIAMIAHPGIAAVIIAVIFVLGIASTMLSIYLAGHTVTWRPEIVVLMRAVVPTMLMFFLMGFGIGIAVAR